MKIVFHEKYYNSDYSHDPAAAPGRLDGIMEALGSGNRHEIIRPEPATEEDILRAHGRDHVARIRGNSHLYEMASLAAGGSVLAARRAFAGNPAFAVVRPPGHHASADSCWGFCFFNNMAVSLLALFAEKKIGSAAVLDFDLHTGDGNITILESRDDGFRVSILNPYASEPAAYLHEIEEWMASLRNIDIIAASAGFDQGLDDWGNLLSADDYRGIGRLMKDCSVRLCAGRRYALLEGGYNHDVLGVHVSAFCEGFE